MDNIVTCVLYASSKLLKFFATYNNSPVITTTVNMSSESAPSLWHGSFLPTATDMLSMLMSYCCFDVEIHTEGHNLHAGNCRGCGQILWPCRKNKNCEIFFLPCWWFAKISCYTV